MLPVQKIVCPTDFSDLSYKALDAAVEMAEKLNAELHLIHVVAPVQQVYSAGGMDASAAPAFNVEEYTSEMKNTASESLKSLAKDKAHGKAEVKTDVLIGNDADQIVGYADEKDIDMIIISTHGRTGFSRLLLGSVAEKVIRHTYKPVLLIRNVPKE